ncbi:MAG: hypothetical protein D6675_00270 [Gemmatimonadetes bacterium]|nr:MAG: hypothetical protein D6675_00270 [Gemmatimonadota bacterium]
MPYSLPPSAMLGEVPGGNGMTFGDMFGAPMEQGGLDFDEVTAYADMDDAVTATGWGGKLGIQYKVTDKLRVGASYTMKSTLDFSGEAGMDMTAQFNNAYERMVMGALVQMSQDGVVQDPMNPTEQELQMAQQGVMQQLSDMGIDMSLGMKAMYDVDIDFSWPQEFGFGVAYAPNDRLIIATDVHWINWEDTMKEFVMHFSNGDNSNINTMMGTPDGSMTLEMPMNWDNQLVVAMGLEFWATPNLAVRTGFNYAKNPVPAETVIPIFPAIVENHLTFGLGYNFNGMFQVDMAYEKVFANELESNGSTIANEYNSCTNELGEDVVHMSGTLRF